jgi:hypothetical protein
LQQRGGKQQPDGENYIIGGLENIIMMKNG